MWHRNPTYDARVFNPIPGLNCTVEFLMKLKLGRSTSMSKYTDSQAQSSNHQDDIIPREDPGDDGTGDPAGTLGLLPMLFLIVLAFILSDLPS